MRFKGLILPVLLCSLRLFAQEAVKLQLPQDTLQVKKLLDKAVSETQSDQAIRLANEALATAERLNYPAGIIQAGIKLGQFSFAAKDYVTAGMQFEKVKLLLSKEKNEYLLGQVYKMLGETYAKRGFYRQAAENFREAVVLLRKTNQLALLAASQEAQGKINLDFGRYANAMAIYQRQLALQRSLNDLKGMAEASSHLAMAGIGARQYDTALFYNTQALQWAADPSQKTELLLQAAVIHSFLNQPGPAASSIQQAEMYMRQTGEPDKTNYFIACILLETIRDNKEKARVYIDSVSKILTGTHNPEPAFTGLGYLAELHNRRGNYKEAYEALRVAERYKNTFRTEHIERMSAEAGNAAEITLKQKEIEYLSLVNKLKAEELSKEELQRLALLRENILKDSSIASQHLLMQALETESELRSRQLVKEKELSLSLSRENQLKETMLHNEQRNQYMLWAGLALLGLLGGIIFLQYRKQKIKNGIIRKQTGELEVLNKEIHHRVKNNLQVISSMLDLQSQSLNDEKATAIIKEGIQRVQSMAFIHQNLYQGSAVNSVNMGEYIRMLSNHLFQTYNTRPDKIRMHTDIEELKLHTDTAIPLGMILNELISNALKYAFRGKEEGDILVVMKRNENELLLQVKDNGVGLPPGFNAGQTSTFGYEIVRAFAQKLKARMNVDGSNGTDVQLIISKFKITENR